MGGGTSKHRNQATNKVNETQDEDIPTELPSEMCSLDLSEPATSSPSTPTSKKDTVISIQDRVPSGDALIEARPTTPVYLKQDSLEVAKQTRRISVNKSGSPKFTPQATPPSPLIRQDSMNVYKVRRESGGDNKDEHARKIASLNANRKKVRASLPPIVRPMQLFADGIGQARQSRNSAPPQLNPNSTLYSPTSSPVSRRGSLSTSSQPNQEQALIDLQRLVDPESAAMLEAKRMAEAAYAQVPLSPEPQSNARSTRRGSLSTSFHAKQDKAHLELLKEVDPDAASAVLVVQAGDVDGANTMKRGSIESNSTRGTVNISRSASIEIPCSQ